MTKYIKFDDNGKAIEAPYRMTVAGGTIYGYNAESNATMLLADGYLQYSGNEPIQYLRLENGEIIAEIPEQQEEPKRYTKLQIRRALRAVGKEAFLDDFLAENETAGKDWQDAQEIALDDEVLVGALPASLKQELISVMEGQNNDNL